MSNQSKAPRWQSVFSMPILTTDNSDDLENVGIFPLAESDGTFKTSNYGKDSAGNLDPFRTNANQQLQIEIVGSGLGTPTQKILGTANPAATTNTNLYTPASGISAEITLLQVTNRSGSSQTFRVGIDVGGNGTDTPGDGEWLYYDTTIQANASLTLDVARGLRIAALDDIVVYAGAQQLAFVLSGIEYA